MDQITIKEISELLYTAEDKCIPIDKISNNYPNIEIQDAYNIQIMNIDNKLDEGKKIVGKKIGLTSLAMQNLLGVNEPDYGHLLDSMEIKNNTIRRSSMLQPRVEGEIAFVLNQDISGPNATVEDVLEATEYVLAAIEVVDSRIKNWDLKITDTVADNASSGMFVTNKIKVNPKSIDLKEVTMTLYKNGEKINSGFGKDVLGDPAYCVAWLANKLFEYDIILKKGEVILSGALSAMVAAESGDEFEVKFSDLGNVGVKFI